MSNTELERFYKRSKEMVLAMRLKRLEGKRCPECRQIVELERSELSNNVCA
jgi:hypothetical protein